MESAGDPSSITSEFPVLSICAAVEQHEEERSFLLSCKRPVLADFSKVSKKSLYTAAVKALNKTCPGVASQGQLDVPT